MSATFGTATSASRPELISTSYRRLRRMGFGDPEAANITALKNGFGITSQPWTVRELAHLLFLHESRRVGRWWSDADDRVDGSDGTRVPTLVDGAPAPRVDRAAIEPTESRHRDDADPSGGAVTLLTLLRSMAGPNATLDQLRRSSPPRIDAASGSDGEGG